MLTNLNTKIYVAGHRGMLGSAILNHLKQLGYTNLITRTHEELDLTNQEDVRFFFQNEKPEQVYLAAARVGGINANNIYPAEFIYTNLMIETNIIHQSWCAGVKKILFIGSSCAYPCKSDQPIKEEALLTGKLELTSEPYAIAKIAGLKMCESYNRQYGESHGVDYRSVVPATLYGPGDSYDLENNHVIPALIRKFHESKISNKPTVTIWGSGTPLREFIYVEDMARMLAFVMNLSADVFNYATQPQLRQLNIGSGIEVSIAELAKKISKIVEFEGKIKFDKSKADGASRKLLDSSRFSKIYNFKSTDLDLGIKHSYKDFLLTQSK